MFVLTSGAKRSTESSSRVTRLAATARCLGLLGKKNKTEEHSRNGITPVKQQTQNMILRYTPLWLFLGVFEWFCVSSCHAFWVPPRANRGIAFRPARVGTDAAEARSLGRNDKMRLIKSTTELYLNNPDPRERGAKDSASPKFQVPSPFTLLIDGLAILLAVEFIGLLQEVNDVDFVENGGWFQPLPTLEEQSSSLSQVLRSWILNVTLWASTLTVVPVVVGETWNTPGANPWTTRFIPAFLSFATLRCGYAIGMAGLEGSEIAWESPLLDGYVVGLALGTIRYLLGNEE